MFDTLMIKGNPKTHIEVPFKPGPFALSDGTAVLLQGEHETVCIDIVDGKLRVKCYNFPTSNVEVTDGNAKE